MPTTSVAQNLQGLQQDVAFAENVKRITEQILATSDLGRILLDRRTEILTLLEGEDLTIFAFDSDKKSSPECRTSTASRKSASPSWNKAWPGSSPNSSALQTLPTSVLKEVKAVAIK